MDTITAPFTLGERFFTKEQTISTTSTLTSEPEISNSTGRELRSKPKKKGKYAFQDMKIYEIQNRTAHISPGSLWSVLHHGRNSKHP